MYNAQTLKKRLDIIMSREDSKKTTSSAKTRNLGMPKSHYGRRLQTSLHRANTSSLGNKEATKPEQVKRCEKSPSLSTHNSRKNENMPGNVFMFKRKPLHGHDDGMGFRRLSVADTLQISSLKEEDYRGRIILTSNENFVQEQHFLPGFKFADVNLRLNSAAINNLRRKQAFKTKDCAVSAKRVIEIRIPSMNGGSEGTRYSQRDKKPYFLYRHQNTLK